MRDLARTFDANEPPALYASAILPISSENIHRGLEGIQHVGADHATAVDAPNRVRPGRRWINQASRSPAELLCFKIWRSCSAARTNMSDMASASSAVNACGAGVVQGRSAAPRWSQQSTLAR